MNMDRSLLGAESADRKTLDSRALAIYLDLPVDSLFCYVVALSVKIRCPYPCAVIQLKNFYIVMFLMW